MEEKKITNIKEKQLERKADENYSRYLKNSNAQDPIKTKFLAFQKTKKDINSKDLF